MIHQPALLKEWFAAVSMPAFDAHYNIAPGSNIVALRVTERGRAGSMMRWGLVPSWVKDAAAMPMLHNARGETIAEKPVYRRALTRRRCLIPASGFYEWKAVTGQRSKQPFYISFKDSSPMALAGMWESAKTADGNTMESCTIITTEANSLLEPVHHRMPLLLECAAWERWLNPEPVDLASLQDLIVPYDASNMQVWGVSHAVNKVANNDPKLLLPIA